MTHNEETKGVECCGQMTGAPDSMIDTLGRYNPPSHGWPATTLTQGTVQRFAGTESPKEVSA
jgi:hypothetical protein